MVQAFSRLILTTEDRIRSQASLCEICYAQREFAAGNSVFLVRIIPPFLEHIFIYMLFLQKEIGRNPTSFQKAKLYRKWLERLIEKCFQI